MSEDWQSRVRERLARVPVVHPEAFVAPTAVLVGEVALHRRASVWYGAVVRGDLEPIEIGEETNIQDLVMVHVDRGFPTVVGPRVTVGHRAVLHGTVVGEEALVGMGAILLTGSRVGAGSLVAAGAVVREGQDVPPRSLVAGVPARVLGEVSEEMRQRVLENMRSYVELMGLYRERKW